MNKYITVSKQGEAEYIERRSKFIAAAYPVKTEQEAIDIIAHRRSKYWDATHNVYAYALREGSVKRYSDDAEPQGTAGIPTLDVITKSGVTDVLIVTTRYFGGILLGGGGLVRAYSHSAKIALDAAGLVTMCPVTDCCITADYSDYGKLDSLLSEHGVIDKSAEFTDVVTMRFSVETENLMKLKADVTDASGGRIQVVEGNERFAPVKI